MSKHKHKRKSQRLPPAADPDALSIERFCQQHSISLSFYFKLAAAGLGPKTIAIGSRRLITREAASEWRSQRAAAAMTTAAE